MLDLTVLDPLHLVSVGSQLQLTQRIPVPQDPVSIIVPIVYDMATGLTQQADIPRQHSSSGAAALMVSNILKRFNELHPARQGEPSMLSTMNNLLFTMLNTSMFLFNLFFSTSVNTVFSLFLSGECTIFASVHELMANLTLPPCTR